MAERDGQVVQLRKDDQPLRFELKTVKQDELQEIKDAFTQPFDLFTGPLCRIVIYATEEYTYLFIDIHHIIADGSALSVFTTDLVTAYQGGDLIAEGYTALEYAVESEALVGKAGYLATEKFFDQRLGESMTVLSQGGQGGGEIGKARNVITYANVFKYQKPQEIAMFLTNKVEETITNDLSTYDYGAIDQLLLKNTLGEIKLSPIGDILLTGATGFLGVHILRDFLEHYPGKVYCLMRSKDGKSADTRLKVRLAYYFEKEYQELFGRRIFTIEGDMNQLVTSNVKVDTVINCAAIVKHFAAGDELEKVNVGGVQKVIDYCLNHDAMLIQVSTTSVAGTGDLSMKDSKIIESQLYLGQSLNNKYTHRKYAAERYVLEATGNKGLKAKIMRVGNLMSRNADGEFQINFQGNSFMSSLKAYKLLEKFPVTFMGGEAEFSPIDSTAKAILRLAQTNEEYTVFHPYNNHAIYQTLSML